ncbi:hypothetical protein K227x_21600 [Rubripirellula lacrimiformis]|uniref:Uncharacterized protein n=1 Tax=Rubripirellula lacrimiformis TaxID=1930273 RepID=A0A517N9G4_9BACT|nr:hypothetical protein K227x_21600 [Rubripirellula lacrimiformis]
MHCCVAFDTKDAFDRPKPSDNHASSLDQANGERSIDDYFRSRTRTDACPACVLFLTSNRSISSNMSLSLGKP